MEKALRASSQVAIPTTGVGYFLISLTFEWAWTDYVLGGLFMVSLLLGVLLTIAYPVTPAPPTRGTILVSEEDEKLNVSFVFDDDPYYFGRDKEVVFRVRVSRETNTSYSGTPTKEN